MYSPSHRSVSRKSSFSNRKQGSQRGTTLSQVIFRSNLNVVETYGPALPVIIREALTFSDRIASASIKISQDGWAWLVCGRRLLVWPCFGEESRRRTTAILCRELTLPSSDLAYRADLVTIFVRSGSQVPSCIAVSPEGVVRYWPSVAHEGASIEVNAELHGQECDSLTDAGELGIILATTTSSLVLISPSSSQSRPEVTVKPLRPPQGWLGGITRLIPSIIFASVPGLHGAETKLVKVVATERGGLHQLNILAGSTLQQWLMVHEQLHSLVFECNVTKLATEAFHKTVWEAYANATDMLVWLLDVQPVDNGLCILMAATNPQASPQFFYAIGTLLMTGGEQPSKFDRFCPIKSNAIYRESDEAVLLSCRFLLYRNLAILHTRHRIFAVSAVNFGEDVDNIDIVGSTDQVLGSSLCRNVPVFFTKQHGLFTILPVSGAVRSDLYTSVSDAALAESTNAGLQPDSISMTLSDGDLDRMENSSNPVDALQAAFVHYLRQNLEVAERLVRESRDREDFGVATAALVALVEKLADAPPMADPRWAAACEGPVLGSASLQIATQIDDKMRAMDAFVCFLKWAKVWDKMGMYRINDVAKPVKHFILEQREKLIALSVIKQFPSSPNSMIDQCIRHVTADIIPEGLTGIDVFFSQASKVNVALQAMTEWCESAAHSDRRPLDTASAIGAANQVILKVFETIMDWRAQNCIKYLGYSLEKPAVEFLPWTAAPGGLRDSLTTQHSLTLKYGVRAAGDEPLRSRLSDQLLKLSDLLLDGWRTHVRSVEGSAKYDGLAQQYDNARQHFIKPFIADADYERATMLAEKYVDMHSLIEICDLTDNMERLDSYCETFKNQNFSHHLFNWYVREGKSGHLLARFRAQAKPCQQEQLAGFLEDHPTLSWVHDILRHDFVSAHSTLQTAAVIEKSLLARKKTIASLSKLCMLASDQSEEVIEDVANELDNELDLIAHQEDLPLSTLVAHGYDPQRMPVLTPTQIIQLYISDQNEVANESDFKKALDLLSWIQDGIERSQLKQSIWCAAILRDSWTDLEADASLDVVLNLLFFKLVDLLECLDCIVEDLLPPINKLLESEELGELRHNRQFQYLLRMGCENFQKNRIDVH